MNGADALVESLNREGVEVIFGISGGAALPIYDALTKENARGIWNILTRHEQGAAHMAEGYARVSGKVGVCLATSGPGATNLVTGIADALLDSVPIVALTGQVPTSVIGTDAFQESDIIGIMVAECRGYIQNWWGQGHEIPERSAQRILKTADQILKAGTDQGVRSC